MPVAFTGMPYISKSSEIFKIDFLNLDIMAELIPRWKGLNKEVICTENHYHVKSAAISGILYFIQDLSIFRYYFPNFGKVLLWQISVSSTQEMQLQVVQKILLRLQLNKSRFPPNRLDGSALASEHPILHCKWFVKTAGNCSDSRATTSGRGHWSLMKTSMKCVKVIYCYLPSRHPLSRSGRRPENSELELYYVF